MARETMTRPATAPGLSPEEPPAEPVPLGPAAAAILAAGIGCLVLGLIVPISEAIPALKSALNWWNPAGPLVGKTTVPVLVWLVAWAALHARWKDREVDFGKVWKLSLAFIAVGFIGTFPPVFEAFTAH
jgi:hypothetical protein